jgi:hypothetical protein
VRAAPATRSLPVPPPSALPDPAEISNPPPVATSRRPAPAGLSAEELAERAHVVSRRALDPDELEAWLLGAGFAVKTSGLLRPTPAAIDVAELLTV